MLCWWTPFTTRILIAWNFLFLLILDVCLAAAVGNEATESKQMQWIGQQWPIVIVFWGGLGAHFFCPKYTEWPGLWTQLKPALCLLLGYLAFLVAWQQSVD